MVPLALSLLLAAPGAAESPQALVDRVLAAYGGRAALQAAAWRVEEGRTTSLLHPGEPGRLRRVVGRDGSLRIEIGYPDGAEEVRVLHQGRATRNGLNVAGTPPHDAMLLQAARLQLPLLLHQARRRIADLGEQDRGGRTVRVLELPLPGGMILQVDIDPATARILRSTGAAAGGRLQFATEYGDFRKVQAILIPFREGNWAQGQHTGDTALEKVTILREPPPGFDEGRSL